MRTPQIVGCGSVSYVKKGPFMDLAELEQLTREKLGVDQ